MYTMMSAAVQLGIKVVVVQNPFSLSVKSTHAIMVAAAERGQGLTFVVAREGSLEFIARKNASFICLFVFLPSKPTAPYKAGNYKLCFF